MSIYTLADADDWTGLFIDGVLAAEGHHLSLMEVLELAIQYPVDEVERIFPDQQWMEDVGSFPVNLEDVELAD